MDTKERKRENAKRFRERHPERVSQWKREWRLRNKEHINHRKREKYAENSTPFRESAKKYAKAHPERRKEQRRLYREKLRKEGRKEKNNRSKNLTIRFKVLARDNFTCQYCGRKAPDVELQVDHILPKSKGGENAISNLITSCKDCNIGKRDYLFPKVKVLSE